MEVIFLKILYTAFNGKQNSSWVLLNKINANYKLYLKNSFKTSVIQLEEKLKNNDYDLIISFGQAPICPDTIKIEEVARNNTNYKTTYNYINLKKALEKVGYKVIVSVDAGTYLCNNLYFHGLKYISDNKLKTKMLFIHIPKISNITDINIMASIFKEENW